MPNMQLVLLLLQFGQRLWVPAALWSTGVSESVGGVHPCGLLLCTLVCPVCRSLVPNSPARHSPLPPPGTARHRYRAAQVGPRISFYIQNRQPCVLLFSFFFSSISTTSSLPARQEDTSGAGVHGNLCPRTAGLPSPVEQWTAAQPGFQLFHAAGVQTARVPKPNTSSASSAQFTSGSVSSY